MFNNFKNDHLLTSSLTYVKSPAHRIRDDMLRHDFASCANFPFYVNEQVKQRIEFFKKYLELLKQK